MSIIWKKVQRLRVEIPIGASASKWRAPKFMKINTVNDIVYTAIKVVEKLFIKEV